MCGISGYIGDNDFSINKIENTLHLMTHRGPDSNGFFKNKLGNLELIFMHTRLSIIDLYDRSNQPFTSGDLTIIFNGEIYNYLELRKKYKRMGYIFETNSDTEVILAAYSFYGKNGINDLEGMWAFAIYDKKEGEVFISRDRFGEKPLLYFYDHKSFAFSSEVKSLFTMLGFKPQINPTYINNFLGNGFRWLFKTPNIQFKNIHKVEAGEAITISSDLKINKFKYWKPKFENISMSVDEAVNGVKHYLKKSLALRLRSDVSLAFCLSGGIDSGALVSLATKLLYNNLDSFSVIDEDERYNEEKEINHIVKKLNINNSKTRVDHNIFLQSLEELIDHQASPIPTVSYYMHSFLQKEISKNGHKVVISGTGADELFAGYYDHSLYWLAQTYSSKDINKNISIWENNFGKYIQNNELQNPYKFIENPNYRSYLFDSNEVLDSLIIDSNLDKFTEIQYSDDLLKNRMSNELFHEIVPVILDQDDKNSMKFSIENRSPFLDKDLVNFAYSIPSDFYFRNGFNKYLLREAMKNILPNKIRLNQEKKGFNASIKSLLNLDDEKIRNILMSDSPIFDYINRNKFKEYIKLDHANPIFSKFLFRFVSCKYFLEKFS